MLSIRKIYVFGKDLVHSFSQSFVSKLFLDSTSVSKEVICLNVKVVETKEAERQNVINMNRSNRLKRTKHAKAANNSRTRK